MEPAISATDLIAGLRLEPRRPAGVIVLKSNEYQSKGSVTRDLELGI
jgi:hypothetical protein